MIGNAVHSVDPCLFSMTHAIAGDDTRNADVHPRHAGRALAAVPGAGPSCDPERDGSRRSRSRFGAPPRDRHPVSAWRPIALVIFVSAFSCTGLGLVCAGIGLRVRETAVLNNVLSASSSSSPARTSRWSGCRAGWRRSRSACRSPRHPGRPRPGGGGVPRERRRADRYRGRDRRRLRLHRLPAAPVHGARKPQTGIAGGGMRLLRLLYVGWLFN